ncbi:MAG: polyprenyl synthetase family protein [Desulfuromonadaceae bacterium]|nr:polyprenyl synthetase family protein [Desulfuromonadaceae bacterium]
MNELKAYLEWQRQWVDTALKGVLPDPAKRPRILHEAMHYSVFAGGKRIRPILMIAACEAVGGQRETVIQTACALEMIHTYSLIHDDLPAMDDDDFRRGVPTNHKVYGEATAILAGDALLTQAFVLLSTPQPGIDARLQQRISQLIAVAAGAAGMVGGQVVDMEAEGKNSDLETVNYIHRHKTGALILASLQAGALLGGADEATFQRLTQFGENAGLAFQIADDLLDIEGNQEELGKDIGSDQARGKATYPAVLGIEESRRQADQLHRQALDCLAPLGDKAQALRAISAYIIQRTH